MTNSQQLLAKIKPKQAYSMPLLTGRRKTYKLYTKKMSFVASASMKENWAELIPSKNRQFQFLGPQ